MKLSWDEVKPYFEDNLVWTNGFALHWYRYVWEFVENSGLNTYYSRVEKLAVYSRIYAVILMYMEFCDAGFECGSEFELDIDLEVENDEDYTVYRNLVEDSSAIHSITDVISKHLNATEIFIGMWITCCQEEIETDNEPMPTYEDYLALLQNGDFDNFVNCNAIGKMNAFQWVSETA